jgi:hypothetical protein
VTHRLATAGLLAAALSLSACADLSPTAQRTMTGAGGYVWDRHQQSRERAFQQGVAAGRASAQ